MIIVPLDRPSYYAIVVGLVLFVFVMLLVPPTVAKEKELRFIFPTVPEVRRVFRLVYEDMA